MADTSTYVSGPVEIAQEAVAFKLMEKISTMEKPKRSKRTVRIG